MMLRTVLTRALVVGMAMAPLVAAAQPSLLKDINTTAVTTPSSPSWFARVGSAVLFGADTPPTGGGLFRTDGTPSGTTLVKRFTNVPGLGAVAGDRVFLTMYGGGNEDGLWVSDGTGSGTVYLSNVQTYGMMGAMGNSVLFAGSVQNGDTTLWKSDGTPGGTGEIAAMNPHVIVPAQTFTYVFFYVNFNYELWKTDGTGSGTVFIKSLPTADFIPQALAIGDRLFYVQNQDYDGIGDELYTSDGTAAGTTLVKDIYPGTSGGIYAHHSDPSDFVAMGGILYFTADDGTHGRELWRSDGTTCGTTMVVDLRPGAGDGAGFTRLIAGDGVLYFAGNDGTSGSELWKSDGTAAGTTQVADITPGSSGSSVGVMALSGGKLLFSATDHISGSEPWVSDGTANGTIQLADLRPGGAASFPSYGVGLDGTFVFEATEDGFTWKLAFSDGTPSGTAMSPPYWDPGTTGSSPVFLGPAGTYYLFAANDGVSGVELWRTDGTTGGTSMVMDICPGGGSSITTTTPALTVDGVVYFAANDCTNGEELWRSDGTTLGTYMVADIEPGPGSSSPGSLIPCNGCVSGTLFFAATTTASGREPWKSDGTAAGTTERDTFTGAAGSNPNFFTSGPGYVYYVHGDPNFGNGTNRFLLADVGYGSNGYTVFQNNHTFGYGADITAIIGTSTAMYYTTIYGELWRGSASDSVLVEDGSDLAWLTNWGDQYSLVVDDVDNSNNIVGRLLIRGPSLIKQVPTPLDMTQLTPAAGSSMYFLVTGNNSGPQLWYSDGTASGTVMLATVGAISNMRAVNDRLFFTVADSAGFELWRSDGTQAGTGRVADLEPGSASSSPGPVVALGSDVLFAATTGIVGQEPWILPNGVTCGNGAIEGTEPCDDGNFVETDGCRSSCALPACGDGIVQAGEDCDDGNVTAGDCCSPTCTFEIAGSSCGADVSVCTAEQCDGSGTCIHPAANAGAPCRPADGLCDLADSCDGVHTSCLDQHVPSGTECRASTGSSDPAEACTGNDASCPADVTACMDSTTTTTSTTVLGTTTTTTLPPPLTCASAPLNGCRQQTVPGKGKISLKALADSTKDGLSWKWDTGASTGSDEIGNPFVVGGSDYVFCLYAGPSSPLVFEALAPAGGFCGPNSCWTSKGTGVFRYKAQTPGAPNGITSIVVAANLFDKAKAKLKGKGSLLTSSAHPLPAAPLATPVRAQLQIRGGVCLEATYSAPSTNANGLFKSKGD